MKKNEEFAPEESATAIIKLVLLKDALNSDHLRTTVTI